MTNRATGWAAQKDQYAVPVMFNPYTGEPRDVRDVQSDPQGILIAPPGRVEMLAATPPAQAEGSVLEDASRNRPVSSDTLYLLRRLLSNQHTLTSAEFREELTKIVGEAAQAEGSVLEDAARYRWLADYLIGNRTDLDDAILACASEKELSVVIDAARSQAANLPPAN